MGYASGIPGAAAGGRCAGAGGSDGSVGVVTAAAVTGSDCDCRAEACCSCVLVEC